MEKLKYKIERPGVAVIVPVHNDEQRIGLLTESLLQQDYPPGLVEIIVVDNRSTDRTRESVSEIPGDFASGVPIKLGEAHSRCLQG